VHLPQSIIQDSTVLSEGDGGQISNTEITCWENANESWQTRNHPTQAYKIHGFTSPSIQTIKHSSVLLILHRTFILVQIMSRSSVHFRI